MDYYRKGGPTGSNKHLMHRQALQKQMTIIEKRKRLQFEAMQNIGENAGAIPTMEEVKTEEIESEEVDIFERKTKFDELLRRMDKHRKENAHLRGNDLRYNIYMKKMQKLTRKDLGLDVEAYKDYINNLKQFATLNSDFEVFAKDSLKVNQPEYRVMIEVRFKKGPNGGGLENPGDIHLFNERCEEIYNTLRKLKRDASAFLTQRDKDVIAEFVKNMRSFLRHYDVYQITKGIYDKREAKKLERQNLINGIIDMSKVTDRHLEDAGVSRKEFDHIKLLWAVDPELFKPSDYGTFSPHSLLVDVSKY